MDAMRITSQETLPANCDVCGEVPAACGCLVVKPPVLEGPRTRVLSSRAQNHEHRKMRPYGEQHGSPRGGLSRTTYQSGGAYRTTATERARVGRQQKKRARQAGKKEEGVTRTGGSDPAARMHTVDVPGSDAGA